MYTLVVVLESLRRNNTAGFQCEVENPDEGDTRNTREAIMMPHGLIYPVCSLYQMERSQVNSAENLKSWQRLNFRD